jgi:uncharacterized protein YggE
MHTATSVRPAWLAIVGTGALLVGVVAGPVLGSVMAPSRQAAVAPGIDGQPAEHTIAVVGSGKVTVIPDMATIQLGVVIEKSSAKAAREAGAAAMTKVITAIRALGIADVDIATATVSLGPVYDYTTNNAQKIRGYQLSNMVSVTVRDLTKVADVLDDGVTAGATSVNGITFDVAERTGAEAKAREAAMADAKAKATTLSNAAGVSITGVASISESVSTPIWYGRDFAAGAAAEASTPVMPGSTDVTISVSVSYLID